jgi:hypothetical protein
MRIAAATGRVLSATADHYIFVNGNFAQVQTAAIWDKVEIADDAADSVALVSQVPGTGCYMPRI